MENPKIQICTGPRCKTKAQERFGGLDRLIREVRIAVSGSHVQQTTRSCNATCETGPHVELTPYNNGVKEIAGRYLSDISDAIRLRIWGGEE